MISTLVDLFRSFYANNDLPNAEAIARSIHSTVPGDPISLQFLGLAYYRSGRILDAVRIFDKILPKQVFPKRKAALGQAKTNRPATPNVRGGSAAAAFYREVTRTDPELAQVWYDLGTTLVDLKKYELAVPAFHNSLVAQPDSTRAMLALARTALRVGDLCRAQDGFSRLQAIEPNNADAYIGLGQVYRKRRDFATARACFVRARLLRGDHAGLDHLASRRKAA